MSSYLRLLRDNPDFARLWVAEVISLLGDWFSFVALSALVAQLSGGSGVAISGLLLARFVPPLIISPMAGVLVDRLNRKTLLIVSDVLRALIVLLLLLANTPDLLWLIYTLTVAQFILSAVFEPARSAITPSLVAPDELLRANTLANVTWSVMLAIGAALGGVTAGLFGTAAALVIDSVSFLLSAALIMRIRTPQDRPQIPEAAAKPSASSFRDGLRYISQRPAVVAALGIKFGLSVGSVDAAMIAYATTLFVIGDNGTQSLGLLYSAFGLGALLGPALLNRFNDDSVRTMRRMIIVSFIVVSAGWFLFGGAPTLALAAAALMVRAAGGSVTWTYSSTIIQMSTDDEYLGRVFSFDWAGFYLATVVSTLVTGLLLDWIGREQVRLIVIGAGVLSLIPLVLWIVVTLWLERREAAPIPVGD